MAIPTPTIGAYPKPSYVPVRDWFTIADRTSTANATRSYTETMAGAGGERLEPAISPPGKTIHSDAEK